MRYRFVCECVWMTWQQVSGSPYLQLLDDPPLCRLHIRVDVPVQQQQDETADYPGSRVLERKHSTKIGA